MKERSSRRNYAARAVERHKLETLTAFARSISGLRRGVRIEVVERDSSGVFKGLIGGYGKISATDQYAAFIADPSVPDAELLLGYYGEAFILEATSLGLGTCWVSGTFNPESVKSHVPLQPGEAVFSITPLGYSAEDESAVSKFARFVVGSKNRKSLDAIFEGSPASIPPWAVSALESARLAPSAMNRQPWLFAWENGSMALRARGAGKRLVQDCGIAALHFELGALRERVSGTWDTGSEAAAAVFIPD
jgi:hypothetical protein